jgi:hypothetical protein
MMSMLIDVVPSEKVRRHGWYPLYCTGVGTYKLMVTGVRNLPKEYPAAQCVATFDREVQTGQRRWNNSIIGQVMHP